MQLSEKKLFDAVAHNQTSLILDLLENGADIFVRDDNNKNILMYLKSSFSKNENGEVVFHSAYKTAEILLKFGADIYSLDRYERNPLFYAVTALDLPTAASFIRNGLHVNAEDRQNKNVLRVLMDMALTYSEEQQPFLKQMTLFLLEKKANPFSKAKDGKTALLVAPKELKRLIVRFEREHRKRSIFRWTILALMGRLRLKKRRIVKNKKINCVSSNNQREK